MPDENLKIIQPDRIKRLLEARERGATNIVMPNKVRDMMPRTLTDAANKRKEKAKAKQEVRAERQIERPSDEEFVKSFQANENLNQIKQEAAEIIKPENIEEQEIETPETKETPDIEIKNNDTEDSVNALKQDISNMSNSIRELEDMSKETKSEMTSFLARLTELVDKINSIQGRNGTVFDSNSMVITGNDPRGTKALYKLPLLRAYTGVGGAIIAAGSETGSADEYLARTWDWPRGHD